MSLFVCLSVTFFFNFGIFGSHMTNSDPTEAQCPGEEIEGGERNEGDEGFEGFAGFKDFGVSEF